MRQGHRVERRLRLEELEPRVAPVLLEIGGQTTYQFLDANRDTVGITLGGAVGRVQILDSRGRDPVGKDIDSITFLQANTTTSLTISVLGSAGNGISPGGRILAPAQTVGTLVVPGPISGMTAGRVNFARFDGGVTGPIELDTFGLGDVIAASGSIRNVTVRGDMAGALIAQNDDFRARLLAAGAGVQQFSVKSPTPLIISGNITTAAERDVFQFTAKAGDRLYFDLDAQDIGSALDAELNLYLLNGAVSQILFSSNDFHGLDPYIDHTFTTTGTYRIEVLSYNGASFGSYDLMVSRDRLKVDAREAGDSMDKAQVVAVLPAVITGSMDNQWDRDFFKFTVAAGATLTFDLDAQLIKSNLSGELILYNTAGVVIGSGTTGGDPNAPLDPIISGFTFPLAGDYYVEVRGQDFHSKGYYKLFISSSQFVTRDLELNDKPELAPMITLNLPVIVNGAVDYAADKDFFGFNAAAGQRLFFEVDTEALGGSLNAQLALHDTQGRIVASSGAGVGSDVILDYTFTTSGYYTIKVQSQNAASVGPYLLYVSQGPFKVKEIEPNDFLAQPQVLTYVPAGVSGLTWSSGSFVDYDFYAFYANAGQTLNLDVDSLTLSVGSVRSPNLDLYDGGGNLLANVAGSGTADPLLTWTFAASATYYARLSVPLGGWSSNYKLYIAENLTRVQEGRLLNDTLVTAQAGSVLPTLIEGAIEPAVDKDFYAFAVVAGQKWIFDIEAQEMGSPLDAELVILDPAGSLLAQSDNVAGATFPLDPRLEYTFGTTGTYYATVQSKGGSTMGPYRLWIIAQDLSNPEYHPNGAASSAIPVGNVASQPSVIVGSIGDSAQEDWYRFDARSGQRFVLDVDAAENGSTLRSTMSLWFGTRFGVLEVASNSGEETGQPDPFLVYTIPATQEYTVNGSTASEPGSGAYFIRMKSAPAADGSGIGGDYRITLNRVGASADVERIVDVNKPVGLEKSMKGLSGVYVTGALSSAGDVDRFVFPGSAGQVWDINVNDIVGATAGEPILLTVRGPNNTLVVKKTATNVADFIPSATFTLPYSGNYVIVLESPTGYTGDYSFTLTRQTWKEVRLLDGQPISLKSYPSLLSGNISASNELDTYLFKASEGSVLSFQIMRPAAGTLDAQLRIVDSAGRVMVSNEDFGGSQDPLLTYRFAKSGTYGVIVGGNIASTVGAATGPYSLLITKTPSSLGGLNIVGDLQEGGLVSAPGSLIGAAQIMNSLSGRFELGLDLAALMSIGAGIGTAGDLWIGNRIASNGRIRVTGDIESGGMIYTRGVASHDKGNNAPLQVDGFIRGDLVVAQPGTVTGRAMVFPIDNGFTPAPGGLIEVVLYNLDGTGRLTGPFADAKYHTGDHAIRPERDNYDFRDIMPTVGATLGTPLGAFSQVEAYWQVDRYHSYMALLGFGNIVNRSIELFVDHPPTDPALENNAYYDTNNRWIRFGADTNGDPVRLGESGSVILHEYNHAVTDELVRVETNYISSPFDQTGAMSEGLSDYRQASFLNQPAYSWDLLADRSSDNFYRYDPVNVSPGIYQTGSILSGALWDLRHLLGPTVVDTLSMAAMPGIGRIVSKAHPDPTLPEMLDEIIRVDNRLFNGAHVDTIRRAFAIHRVGAYNFNAVANYPFHIVNPTVPAGTAIVQVLNLGVVRDWDVTFNDLITKIAPGDRLFVNGVEYPAPDGFYTGTPSGRGQHTVKILSTDELRLELLIGTHTEGNPQVSFGFQVTNITPA